MVIWRFCADTIVVEGVNKSTGEIANKFFDVKKFCEDNSWLIETLETAIIAGTVIE